MTIFLTQWKCPDNHAIIALCWDDAETELATVHHDGEAFFTPIGNFNRWCGICGSKEIAPQTDPTPFTQMEHAVAGLKALELRNRLARLVLGRF